MSGEVCASRAQKPSAQASPARSVLLCHHLLIITPSLSYGMYQKAQATLCHHLLISTHSLSYGMYQKGRPTRSGERSRTNRGSSLQTLVLLAKLILRMDVYVGSSICAVPMLTCQLLPLLLPGVFETLFCCPCCPHAWLCVLPLSDIKPERIAAIIQHASCNVMQKSVAAYGLFLTHVAGSWARNTLV